MIGKLLKGRLPRLRFFLYWLGLSVMGWVCAIALYNVESALGAVLLISGWILIVIALFNIFFRRLNDRNTTGWASLFLLVPFVGYYMLAILFFGKGTNGPNKYGPAPGLITSSRSQIDPEPSNVSPIASEDSNLLAYQGLTTQSTGGLAATQMSGQAPEAWLKIASGRGAGGTIPIHGSISIGRALEPVFKVKSSGLEPF